MESYLEQKYGKKFEVADIKTEGAGLGMPGQLTGNAHKVGDRSTIFEVGQYSTGEHYDMYMKALWSKEAQPDLEHAVASIFNSKGAHSKADVVPYSATTGKADYTSGLYGKTPSLSEQLARDSAVVQYSIAISIKEPFDDTAKPVHAERIRKLAEYVAEKHAGKDYIRYVVNLPDEDKRYICNETSANILNNIKNIDSCFLAARGHE